jgi:hypothetical protein
MKKEFKHPHTYGVMVMVDKKDYNYISKYRKKLKPYVEFFMKKDNFENIAPQHISMCYFSYPDKYPKEYVIKLLPKIKEIAEKYLPLKVAVKGLLGGWEIGFKSPVSSGQESPVIMWNITDFTKINRFHEELISALKSKVQHFNEKNLDFSPHIGIALGKQENLPQLKRLVQQSKHDKEIILTLSSVQIYFPTGPEEVYKKNLM